MCTNAKWFDGVLQATTPLVYISLFFTVMNRAVTGRLRQLSKLSNKMSVHEEDKENVDGM